MSIKLIARKKIGFRNPDNKQEIIIAEPLTLSTMPDWIANDPMYAWAKADGSIEVSNTTPSTDKTNTASNTKDTTTDSGKKK